MYFCICFPVLCVYDRSPLSLFFFFNDTATTEIYTLSLHDALPIWLAWRAQESQAGAQGTGRRGSAGHAQCGQVHLHCRDRKSTRLNSSHSQISYAVFCLKKKKKQNELERESSAACSLDDTAHVRRG